MKIEVFGKEDCSLCKSAMRKVKYFLEKWGRADEVEVAFVNMDTVDGMAEGMFRDVSDVPVVIVSDNGSTFGRWDGEPPKSEELKGALEKCS